MVRKRYRRARAHVSSWNRCIGAKRRQGMSFKSAVRACKKGR